MDGWHGVKDWRSDMKEVCDFLPAMTLPCEKAAAMVTELRARSHQ